MKQEKHIFERNGCLTLDAMQRYGANDLEGSEKTVFEKHLNSCVFCKEALDGIVKSKPLIARNKILILRKKINAKNSSGNKKEKSATLSSLLSVAAISILIIGLFFIIKYQEKELINSDLANNSGTKTETPLRPLPRQDMNVDLIANNMQAESNQGIMKLTPELNPKENSQSNIYEYVDEMPVLPGGIEALDEVISENISSMNKQLSRRTCGKVLVQFLVDESGNVALPKVIQSPDPKLSKAALQLIDNLPEFIPGKEMGQNVKVLMTIPLRFGRC